MTTSEALCRERNAQRRGARRVSEQRMERMLAALEPVRPDEGFVSIHAGDAISLPEILSRLMPQEKERLSHEHFHQTR